MKIPWTRKKNILRHYLFGDKILQNCLKIDETHLYDNGLLLRLETQKRLHVMEANVITITKNIDLMSLAERIHFSLDVFQMTTIALVSVINH